MTTSIDFFRQLTEDESLARWWRKYEQSVKELNLQNKREHEDRVAKWRKPYADISEEYESRSSLYRAFIGSPYSRCPILTPRPQTPDDVEPTPEGFYRWMLEANEND
jgi:hypothetical protein